jgi:hypothetical protein
MFKFKAQSQMCTSAERLDQYFELSTQHCQIHSSRPEFEMVPILLTFNVNL